MNVVFVVIRRNHSAVDYAESWARGWRAIGWRARGWATVGSLGLGLGLEET